MRWICLGVVAATAVGMAGPALAADGAAVDGRLLGLVWVVPFAGILLSIALCPLLLPQLWHHHYGKIGALWACSFLVPFALVHGGATAWFETMHMMVLDYVPFMMLILALYATAGGVLLTGTLRGTPATNTVMLAIGTLVASLTGTTGAAMLLVRPMLRANAGRTHQAHTFIFFIFLVANIGGSLTPLGDPPLFLGFLRGVAFFWPTQHMLAPMLLASVLLLAVYFVLDNWHWRHEPEPLRRAPPASDPVGLEGGINVVLLLAVVATVLMIGLWRPGPFPILGQQLGIQTGIAVLLFVAITALSVVLTPRDLRIANGFTWEPMKEVAKLFCAIFITIIPALAILRAGDAGALGWLIELTSRADGSPNPATYFWLAGGLSSFLDNAPTYLIFFNLAGDDPVHLMGEGAQILLAISAGAVFMGANSYIGNAPNFLVKAIAEEKGVPMPSFFGYCGWAVMILIPIFLLLSVIFFR
ncbi:MAG: sodium:proton antiporter [Acetobacteraceae bacterium]|nr:sodium:proton antiporter [Acetobacteraceae bacterium]